MKNQWQKKHPEKLREYNRRYRQKHPEQFKESYTRSKICNDLKRHAENLSEDPERLRTEFMIALINRDDKKTGAP